MEFKISDLVRERDVLEMKIIRLMRFTETNDFQLLPRPLSAAIAKQIYHMKEYAAALNDRIVLMK